MGTTEKTELTVMCMICDGTKILVQDRVNKDWRNLPRRSC